MGSEMCIRDRSPRDGQCDRTHEQTMSDAVPRRVRQHTPSLQAALLTHTCSSPCRSNTPFPTRLIPNETPPAQAWRHNDCGGDHSPDERQHHRTHGVRAECTAATTPQLGCAAGCTVGVSRWEWARGVGTRFWMCCVRCAVRRGGSGGIRADIPASRTIPGRSVTGCWAFTPDGRFHSRRARRPASCTRGLSAREEAGPDPPKDAPWPETLVYTPGGRRGGRSDFKADSVRSTGRN